MSIGTAFHSATTGLAASARLAETVSTNVANALTEGHARLSTELSSLPLGSHGGGVRVVGTVRAENAQLTGERRRMEAATGAASTLGAARGRVLAAVGEPGESGSLAARATALEATLIAAAATPSSSAKLGQALDAAKGLIGALASAAREAAQMRTDAESEIGRQVGLVNEALHDVKVLNSRIQLFTQQNLDTATLEDERSRVIDRITEIVPVRTVKRGAEVALYTASGGALLDGRVWELSFRRSATEITAEMTVELNGLQQDRGSGPETVSASNTKALFGGGSLAALFQVRDEIAPELLKELDAYAEDLVGRFSAPSMPAEALNGGAGLFLDPADGGATGLSVRLGVNPAVDPAMPDGQLRRLRDGLGSDAAGPAGFADYLQAMVDAMTRRQNPGDMVSTGADLSAADLAGEIGSFFGAHAARADDTRAYLAGQSAILSEQEAGAVGVDTDAQLQFLMLVEQSYAANARVLTVIDSLMKQLLEM